MNKTKLSKILITAFLFLFAVSVSTTAVDPSGYDIYTIREGNHYPDGTHFAFSGSTINFEAVLTQSCYYDESIQGDKTGWNKLYGITSSRIHTHSARMVWRPGATPDTFRLAAYVYIGGDRLIEELGTVDADTPFQGKVAYKSGKKIEISLIKSPTDITTKTFSDARKPWPLFRAYPYFGGQSTAPHDMEIWVKNI